MTFIREQGGNFTSKLHVRDLGLNNSLLTCEGVYLLERGRIERITDTTAICVLGKAMSVSSVIIITIVYCQSKKIRSSLSSHWAVSGVGPTISCGQFPVSSVR